MIQNITNKASLNPTPVNRAAKDSGSTPEVTDSFKSTQAKVADGSDSVGKESASQAPVHNGKAPEAPPAPSQPAPAAPKNAPVSLMMDEPTPPSPEQDPDSPQYGLKCSSYLRPDPFYMDKTVMVIHAGKAGNNPGGVKEVPHGKYQFVEVDKLLGRKDQVLIGFGSPKVTALVPDGKDGYQKLDAAPLFKRETRIVSGEVVQTGVFIRPRNLPAEALDSLRTAMSDLAGHRSLTTAKATAKMLNKAGFTCGGESIKKFTPMKLFSQINEHGLEYKGTPLKYDIISTTNDTIDEHFRSVVKHELCDALHAETDNNPDLPKTEETNGTTPVTEKEDPNAPKVHIRNSRPGFLGNLMRNLMGCHVMWEAVPDTKKLNIDDFLPDVLKDKFHDDKPLTKGEKVKAFIFTPGKVKFLRKAMASGFDDGGEFTPKDIAKMLRVPGEGEKAETDKDGLIKYNIVMMGDKSDRGAHVVIARLKVQADKADDILTKHVLISGYDKDVRFAGEMWAERYKKEDGTEATRIHVSNNSGTYRPSPEQAVKAGQYLEKLFPGVEIVVHAMRAPLPQGKPDYLKTFPITAEQNSEMQKLEGTKVTLKDDKGESHEYNIRKFKTMEFDTEFFDTADHQLEGKGDMLRARTRYKKPGGEEVKEVVVEAKMAPADPKQAYSNRIEGSSYETLEEWQNKKTTILSPKTGDSAVFLARSDVSKDAELQTTALKNSMRELYTVSPTTPIIGRFNPKFFLMLDTNTMREPGAARPTPEQAEKNPDAFRVFTPTIFTKLPWSKKITPDRVAELEDLSKQMADKFGLTENKGSAYAEAMDHLKK